MKVVGVLASLAIASTAYGQGMSVKDLPVFDRVEAVPSICGEDDRRPSNIKPVARMMKDARGRGGCTGTMISDNCMLSAGHCIDYLKFAQFNVPASDAQTGKVNYPDAQDEYKVTKVYDHIDRGMGSDWAVYRIAPNEVTGLSAGDAYGTYEIDMENRPYRGQVLRITGFGVDYGEKNRNLAQQTHTSTSNGITSGTRMRYVVDTMGGNSGSSVIDEKSQKIIGVHTHGGCTSGGNSGTTIYGNERFQRAIAACLGEE